MCLPAILIALALVVPGMVGLAISEALGVESRGLSYVILAACYVLEGFAVVGVPSLLAARLDRRREAELAALSPQERAALEEQERLEAERRQRAADEEAKREAARIYRCPKCRMVVHRDASICPYCRSEFGIRVRCSECAMEVPPASRICPYCRTRFNE